MSFVDKFEEWSKKMIGRTVRGQQVEHCEMTVDTFNGPGHPIRIILGVVFRENPPTNESKEKNLLQRVFSTITSGARLEPVTQDQLDSVFASEIPDEDWFLDDEISE